MESHRLNKFLAYHLGVSRREADDLISAGKVTIDGTTAVLGSRVDESSHVTVSGADVTKKTAYTYLVLNKPVGYVCSRRRQGDNPTIYELLPEGLHNLKPVGRLDKDSSGLLVLTDDGDYAHQMTHPKFRKTKVYEVALDHELTPLHQQMISDYGVTLEDGVSTFLVTGIDQGYQVTMQEGRNRQIRRTFAALGYEVTSLHRTQFGPLALGELASGSYESFTP